jgi:hypothetical protein
MRLLAIIVLILVPSFASAQDAAMRLAASIEWPKEKPAVAAKLSHYDVLCDATAKGVPLITYVGCEPYSVAGVPAGTMYCKVDWLTGYPNRCIVVSVPNGKGWHHGWELPSGATDAQIRARLAPQVMRPMAFQPSAPMFAPMMPAMRGGSGGNC